MSKFKQSISLAALCLFPFHYRPEQGERPNNKARDFYLKSNTSVGVGTIDSFDRIAIIHIMSALVRLGIPVGIGGSAGYGVTVPRNRAEEAREVLKKDS